MIERLYVTKQSNNYADTFLMLGLAQLAEFALKATKQKSEIHLIDEGNRYCIQFKKAVDLEPIAKLQYFDPFPIVKGQKTDISKIPQETIPFDTVEQSEQRKIYKDYQFQQRGVVGVKTEWTEEAPKPPDPRTQNGVILTSMRHDRNHNELWLVSWELKDKYGLLIASLFQGFSQENSEIQTVVDLFEQATDYKLPNTASAVKIYQPTSIQGVNRVKADNNKFDSQTTDWLSLWLIATGLFHFGITEWVKISERTSDWRVVALQPKDIQFSKYRETLRKSLIHNPPGGKHSIARFDAELVLRFCQELLNHQQVETPSDEEDDFDLCKPVNHFVSSLLGTHFGSKGQVYGVKYVFSLGLPAWIYPNHRDEILDYQKILTEHLIIVKSLPVEGESELLNSYRDFITGGDLHQFFRFQTRYADYVIKQLATGNHRTVLFSKHGIDLMMKNFKYRQDDQEWSLTEITQDPGFLNIAKAINSATVYAGVVRDKDGHTKDSGWERMYGLAQRLSSQSGSKKDFVIEISSFLASYENENLRIDDDLRKQEKSRRIWTTKDDLDRLIYLIDKFGSSLIANLLIAYGYAKGWGKPKDKEPGDTKNLAEQQEHPVLSS